MYRSNTRADQLRYNRATQANMRLAGMSYAIRMTRDAHLCTSTTGFALRTHHARAHQLMRRQPQRNACLSASRERKKIFLGRPRITQFVRNLRKFAQTSSATQARARVSDQCSARANVPANRSRSASVFVSVAHTSNTFSYSGYSSPRAKPATIFSCASRSTTSCAEHGNLIATS